MALPIPEEANEHIAWIVAEWIKRRPYYQYFRRYYEGDHILVPISDKYRVWFSRLIRSLRLNLCENVVDAVVDRLEIMNWDPVNKAGSNGQEPSSLQSQVEEAWTYSRGPAVMNEVHEGASVEGDGYVLVWEDAANQRRLWPHKGAEMILWYPPELPDVPAYAGKLWEDKDVQGNEIWRLNIYYNDRVDRYRSIKTKSAETNPPEKGEGWRMMGDADTPEERLHEEEFTISHSFGEVPVAHFTQGSQCNQRGRSDLKNATPVQDTLNKAIVDLVVTGEGSALPLRVLTGVQMMPNPDTGELEGPNYDPRTDSWMNVANEQAKLYTAAGADVAGLIEAVEHHIVNMARVTKTPPERLLAKRGGVETGVSRKVAEAPLVSKVITRRQWYEPSWRKAMSLLGFSVLPHWAPATFETEEERWTVAKMKVETGVPLPQILSELGYTDQQIKDMFDMQQQQDANLGNVILRAFREGQDPAALLNGGQGGEVG